MLLKMIQNVGRSECQCETLFWAFTCLTLCKVAIIIIFAVTIIINIISVMFLYMFSSVLCVSVWLAEEESESGV